MPYLSRFRSLPALLVASVLLLIPAAGQDGIPSPLEEFGFSLGDDYHLANYRQLVGYWKKLEATSKRMRLVQIGETAEGRPMWMAIITSPQNQDKLRRYQEISRLLALAEVNESQARELAQEGRAIVWIDGGLHATETLGAQQLMELVYQMVNLIDRETLRFLNDVILLAVCTNPDGLDLVADWYMRAPEPSKRTTRGLPRLYHRYVGHDNNRDFYMSSQPETEAINRVLYRQWFPQIVYNHHQAGPSGTVLFAPPLSRPFQPQHRPTRDHHARSSRRGHAQSLCCRGQGWSHHAERSRVFNLVEWRAAYDSLLPQHDRFVDGNHWKSNPDEDPVSTGPAACHRRFAFSD